MKRRVAAAVVVLAAAGAALVWLAVEPSPPVAERSAARPPVGLLKAAIVLRHRGQKQAEITADRVEVSADGQTATFSGHPNIVVYLDGAPLLTASGGRVVLDRRTQDVRVDGGLRVTTARGEALTAGAASWRQGAQVLDLTGGVEVAFPTKGRSP